MNLAIQNTNESLNALKNEIIGLFKIGDNFELVIDFDKDTNTIDTVRITQFGSLQNTYNIPFNRIGHFKLFPYGKNMNEMLENPFDWSDFIKSFGG